MPRLYPVYQVYRFDKERLNYKSSPAIATLANLVGSEESAQLSVWKLGVASCNFTTSIGEVGEVGKIGSFEGLGRETEEVSQLSVWKLLSFLQHAEELEFL